MPRFPSLGDRYERVTLGVALVAALGVAFAASPLPRLTPDSASYLTGAETLAESGRFDSCTGPITLFAPGYSAALAPLVALGLDAPDAARLVNVLVTFALVAGAGVLARVAGLGARGGLVVVLAVAVAYATLRNGALVWSEPLFCALLVWILVLTLDRGRVLDVRPTKRLAAVILLTWALLLTRHSGVFMLPAILLAAWLGSRPTRRAARVAALGVVLLAAPGVWWARNVRIDGDPFGRRSESRFTALDVLEQVPDAISSLAVPNALPLALRLALLVPLVVAAALAWRRVSDSTNARAGVMVLTTVVVVYVASVTLAATRTVVDPLDTRLLSPVLVPLAVLVAIGVTSPRTRLERGLRGFGVGLVLVMAVLAPGVVWRGHEAERTLSTIPDDTSCAEWPTLYSATG